MPPKDRDPQAPPRESGLSGEERALWRQVNQDTAPLKKKPPPPERGEQPAPEAHPTPVTPAKSRPARAVPAPKPPAPRRPPPDLGHGDIADVDKRNAERMRRGRMAIQGTLDLHGLNQDQARRELTDYLADAQDAGKRCILVITGKGDITQGGGIIRTRTPRWLNDPENRARVLAFDYAQPKHGGMGAIYVLLRKRRT